MLDNVISITVPSTQGVSARISSERHQARGAELLKIFCDIFGGATAVKGTGGYIADDGQLVIEPVIIITSYTEAEHFEAKVEEIKAIAEWYAHEWEQESIAWTANGVMYFSTAPEALTV